MMRLMGYLSPLSLSVSVLCRSCCCPRKNNKMSKTVCRKEQKRSIIIIYSIHSSGTPPPSETRLDQTGRKNQGRLMMDPLVNLILGTIYPWAGWGSNSLMGSTHLFIYWDHSTESLRQRTPTSTVLGLDRDWKRNMGLAWTTITTSRVSVIYGLIYLFA